MKTNIADVLGTPVLGGALLGRSAFGKLRVLAQDGVSEPTPWFWDLKNIDVASPSFTRECFLSLQALLRAQRSMLIPVIANANSDVREDLQVMFKDAGRAIVTCACDHRGRVKDVGLIGALEAHAEITLAMVIERGETDAGELTKAQGGEKKVGQTAWNNRLASLVELGALIELPYGRAKRYRPVVQEN